MTLSTDGHQPTLLVKTARGSSEPRATMQPHAAYSPTSGAPPSSAGERVASEGKSASGFLARGFEHVNFAWVYRDT